MLHRVERVRPGRPGLLSFTTRGDANNASETWSIPADGQVGRYVGRARPVRGARRARAPGPAARDHRRAQRRLPRRPRAAEDLGAMRTLALTVLAAGGPRRGGASAPSARCATRRRSPRASRSDATGPLFVLEGLRHGDRAERCVTVTNEGAARPRASPCSASGRAATSLTTSRSWSRAAAPSGTLLFSGRLDDFAAPPTREPLAGGASGGSSGSPSRWPALTRRCRAAAPCRVRGRGGGSAGRRARTSRRRARPCRTLALRRDAAAGGGAPGPDQAPPRQPADHGEADHPDLRRARAAAARAGDRAADRQAGPARPGFGRVGYRVGRGAAVVSRRRPFRVRIAPGALKPGRNVVRVVVVPQRAAAGAGAVRPAIAGGSEAACELG